MPRAADAGVNKRATAPATRMASEDPTWRGLTCGSRAFLLGAHHDPDSALAPLEGNRLVLGAITDTLRRDFVDASLVERASSDAFRRIALRRPTVGAITATSLFPAPSDIDVNMMPFLMWNPRKTLPESLHGYLPLIYECAKATTSGRPASRGLVAYLTVQESAVLAGQAQRRAGLHVERPRGGHGRQLRYDGAKPPSAQMEYLNAAWGLGHIAIGGNLGDIPVDGIFMANTAPGSCHVWPALIGEPERTTDAHGGVEHLRAKLGAGVDVGDDLIWFTDRTPHESLPVAQDCVRQFFRLIVGPISVWHAAHNTANPLGTLPDAVVSDEDRFSNLF